MNPFNAHPHDQGISYSAHLLFAAGIAIRLMHSVIVFALHGLFPFIGIRRELDLEATILFLHQQNNWIENQKLHAQPQANEQWERAA